MLSARRTSGRLKLKILSVTEFFYSTHNRSKILLWFPGRSLGVNRKKVHCISAIYLVRVFIVLIPLILFITGATLAQSVSGLSYGLDDPVFDSLQWPEIFLSFKTPRQSVGPTQPTVQLVSRVFFPECETRHITLSSVEFENVRNCASDPAIWLPSIR
jgi:hypothetical protein